MKKRYKMENLDCANCAAKMENGIKKLEGVVDASISFMTQRLTIEMDDARAEEIMIEANKICQKVDSECHILL